jgi:hypothetical protein
MKILFFLAATAFTVAIAADDKPKAIPAPAQTALTAVEHDELTRLFITALSQENNRLAALIDGKLGVELQNAATKSAQEYGAKLGAFQKTHNATGCTWAFFDKAWACPPVAQSELNKKK